jgi:hypothetical protein
MWIISGEFGNLDSERLSLVTSELIVGLERKYNADDLHKGP